MACECCRYHGTEDAYSNEPVVDNEQVHALLLYDNVLAVYLPDPLSGCWGIEAVIPIDYCPRCGRKLAVDGSEVKMAKYDYISNTFVGPTGLDAKMTLDELVTLVARKTTLTGAEVEQRIVGIVSLMLEQYEPNIEE